MYNNVIEMVNKHLFSVDYITYGVKIMAIVKKIRIGKYAATLIIIRLEKTSFLEFVKIFHNEYNRLQMSNCDGLERLVELINHVHEKQEYTEDQKSYILSKIVNPHNIEDGYLHYYILDIVDKERYKLVKTAIFDYPEVEMEWLKEFADYKLSDTN